MEPTELRRLLAAHIRAAAKAKGLGLNAAADFAAVSRAQLFVVLKRSTAPTTDWLAKLAGALDIEPWRLLAPRLGRSRP